MVMMMMGGRDLKVLRDVGKCVVRILSLIYYYYYFFFLLLCRVKIIFLINFLESN